MPSADLLNEADRVMVICNACRYCEGFCAVFPAMERRRTFAPGDLMYLANLCHNCRGCYYACQYAPPHAFDVNVPKYLGRLRLDTYRRFAWPGFLKRLFRRNGWAVALITLISTVLILLLTVAAKGPANLVTRHLGENAFYQVIAYPWIVFPFSILGLCLVGAFLKGLANFWRETGGKLSDLTDVHAHLQACRDTLRLKYLDGGGHGCNYPDDRFSMVRRWYHHLAFYGFLLCLASTTVAAIYEHFLHWSSPYPFGSWPVLLGATGGVALLIGTGGLLYLKQRMDSAPYASEAFGMDVAFLVLLGLTSLTGLLLLVLRETFAMGALLVVHIGMVAGLFLTMPYGKFIHAVYRYAALVRNAIEAFREND